MSARPNYDKDLLLRLKMEHPEWTDEQVAAALTQDNLARGKPRIVSATMVQSAVFRNRTKWAALGFTLPRSPRRSQYIRDLMRLRGHRHLSSEENTRSVPLKRLRYCERLALGLKVPKVEADKARSWEAAMRQNRTVVDIDRDGHAFVRAALWYELDEQGNIISLTAQPEPGNPDVASIEPNLEDEIERAIWEREGLTPEAKAKLILEFRTASLTEVLDEPAEKIPNGQSSAL